LKRSSTFDLLIIIMSYDTYAKTSVIPPGRERRNSYDSFRGRTTNNFPDRNTNTTLEEIELGPVNSRSQQEDRFGSSFDLLEVRRSFIRKVYGIVGLELLLMTVIITIFMFSPLRDKVYMNNTWMIILYVFMIVPLVIVLTLVCCPVD
jgi:hypothetical protein